MKKFVCEYKIKGKDEIKEYSDNNDMSTLKSYINFKKDTHNIEERFNQVVGKIFSKYYEELLGELKVEILRESFAEKDLRIKSHKYNYSVKFNFYECLSKKKMNFGFIAEKGKVLAELIINISFE